MSKKDVSFEEFLPVSLNEWEEKINKDLKGKPLSVLEWEVEENLTLMPYFNKENIKEIGSGSKSKTNKKSNQWSVNAFIKIRQESEANKQALKHLEEGVDSLTFRGDDIDLEVLLKDIMIEIITVHFITRNPLKLAQDLKDLCLKRAITFVDIEGSISFDYLGNFARKGKWLTSKNKIIESLNDIVSFTSEADLKAMCASNSYFQHSGATVAQQIGIALAQGTEYLNLLTPKFSADELANKIQFEFAIGNNYFLEIAKIRAFRLLWSKVLTEFDSTETETKINASTSTLFWSNKQPKNNMLRATSAAMSAVLGGCDSLTIKSFDEVDSTKKSYASRIASNVQLILKKESYFDKVTDPSNGSYFIETLTAEIAENGWLFFQEIEKNGGYIGALEVDFIQNKVFESGEKLIEKYKSNEISLVGVNKYETDNKSVTLKQKNEPLKEEITCLSFLHID